MSRLGLHRRIGPPQGVRRSDQAHDGCWSKRFRTNLIRYAPALDSPYGARQKDPRMSAPRLRYRQFAVQRNKHINQPSENATRRQK